MIAVHFGVGAILNKKCRFRTGGHLRTVLPPIAGKTSGGGIFFFEKVRHFLLPKKETDVSLDTKLGR